MLLEFEKWKKLGQARGVSLMMKVEGKLSEAVWVELNFIYGFRHLKLRRDRLKVHPGICLVWVRKNAGKHQSGRSAAEIEPMIFRMLRQRFTTKLRGRVGVVSFNTKFALHDWNDGP